MKKIILFAMVIAMFTACSSSKKIASLQSPKRVKIEKEACQKLAEEKSDFLRGYGIGTSADKMMARDLATAAARNEILNQIQVSASNMIEKYNQQHSTSGKGQGMTREDQGKATQMIRSIAEETLNGVRVIGSDTYKVGTNFEMHVCVELTNVDFTKKVYNKLSKDEKLMIDYEADKFKKDFEKELEAYRQRKAAAM